MSLNEPFKRGRTSDEDERRFVPQRSIDTIATACLIATGASVLGFASMYRSQQNTPALARPSYSMDASMLFPTPTTQGRTSDQTQFPGDTTQSTVYEPAGIVHSYLGKR